MRSVGVITGLLPQETVPAAHRTGLSGAASYEATPLAGVRPTLGQPTLVVGARMSTASATCAVYVLLYHKTAAGVKKLIGLAGPGVQTATADANVFEASGGITWRHPSTST